MKNYKLILEYDGSRYQGWQRLGKGESSNTLSNKLLDVLQKMDPSIASINCGCRTEVGVHAYGQVVNFQTNSAMKDYEIKNYINQYLPQDISVVEIEEMPERYHATLNASSKVYSYRIAMKDYPSVFERKYVYHSFKTLNTKTMQEASDLFLGTHDFSNFSSGKRNKSTVKTIKCLTIYNDEKELQITIEASDFLHNMCRIILGVLIDIGSEKCSISQLEKWLENPSETVTSGPCDPCGLFLEEIKYNKSE